MNQPQTKREPAPPGQPEVAAAEREHIAGTTLTQRWTALRSDRMARTSSALMAVTVLNSALGYGFWALAARQFSASQVGVANAIISTSVLVAIVSDFGMRTVVMQELPQARRGVDWSRWVSTCTLIVTAVSLVLSVIAASIIAASASNLSGFMTSVWPLAFVALTLATALANLLDGISTAEHAASGLLRRNAITAAAKLVILIGFALGSIWSWRAIVMATLLATLLGVGYGFRFQLRLLNKEWSPSLRGAGAAAKSLRSSMIGHHLLNLGGQLPMYIMPLEVVSRLSARQNAYMSLTWMLAGAFLLVSPAVSSALYVQGRWSPEEMRATTARALKLIAALLIPLGIGTIALGHWVLGIFGPAYAREGYLLLCLLVASAVPDALTNVQIAIWRAEKKLALAARLNLMMAVIALIGTWVLLPSVGIAAVGYSWFTAQAIGCLVIVIGRRRPGAKRVAGA